MGIESIIFGNHNWSANLLTNYGINLKNLHNSYLLIHYRMGVFGFFLLMVFIINYLKMLILDNNRMLNILYLMIFLRGFTDTIFLDNFDFVIYYLIFLVSNKYLIFKKANSSNTIYFFNGYI
jgi:hypothetical protein